MKYDGGHDYSFFFPFGGKNVNPSFEISLVFIMLRDILVECFCVSLWQTRYIGSIDCRRHDGGSMSDGIFICSFSFHGTYEYISPERGSTCESPTLTSHRSGSITPGKYWTYLWRHFILPTREFLLLCLRKLIIGDIRGSGHLGGLVTSEVWSLARCGH